jgi:hypothetical protein
MATTSHQTDDKKKDTSKTIAEEKKQLNTEGPISEKDEVKKAEDRTAQAAKKP